MSILPRTFPAFPERTEFDIYATIKPAREVGGDFYHFFFVDDEHLFVAIGDVSGKGVPASLFMAITRTLLKANATQETPPNEIVERVNDKLAKDNETCVFVTVFCGLLNIASGEVRSILMGGTIRRWLSPPGIPPIYVSVPEGMALGVMDGIRYRTGKLVLQPGDVLFMYTDGVTEAMNLQHELFSEKRLLEDLLVLRGRSLEDMSQGLMERIAGFAEGAQQSDDIAMIVPEEYHGNSQREVV